MWLQLQRLQSAGPTNSLCCAAATRDVLTSDSLAEVRFLVTSAKHLLLVTSAKHFKVFLLCCEGVRFGRRRGFDPSLARRLSTLCLCADVEVLTSEGGMILLETLIELKSIKSSFSSLSSY